MDPVIRTQRRKPRKAVWGGLPVHVLHWWGVSRALLGAPGSPIWSVGLSVPTQSARQGDLSSLGTGISLFLYGSFQNTFAVTHSPWEERQLSVGYILAVMTVHFLTSSLPPVWMEKSCGTWRLSLLQKVTACPSQREMCSDKGSLGETVLASLQVTLIGD